MANKTVTVKAAGGDYTSLNAALAGEKAANPDLVAMAGILTIECYDLGTNDVAADTGTGWTTNSSFYIHIIVPTSDRHDGKWNTSKYRIHRTGDSFTGGGLTIQANYTRVTGLQVKRLTGGGFDNLWGIYVNNASNCLIEKCIIWLRVGHGSTSGQGIYLQQNATQTVRNCVVFADGAGGITSYVGYRSGNDTFSTQYFYNCLSNGMPQGFQNGTGKYQYKNCVVQGSSSAGAYNVTGGTNDGSDYNLSSHSTAPPGTTVYASKTVVFVDAANGDFHLHASDTEAKGKGTDLSATGFNDDIDGDIRTGAWDLGPDQSAAGALTSGTASGSATGSTTASVSVGTATGGTAPYSYQWYRSTSPGFTPGGGNIVSGATGTTLNDTGLTPSTTYYYKCVVTDDVLATATSNEVSLTTSSGTTTRRKIMVC